MAILRRKWGSRAVCWSIVLGLIAVHGRPVDRIARDFDSREALLARRWNHLSRTRLRRGRRLAKLQLKLDLGAIGFFFLSLAVLANKVEVVSLGFFLGDIEALAVLPHVAFLT